MPSILMVARAHARANKLAIVTVAVLASTFGAAAVGALAASVRTATAFDRLVSATSVDDVRVSTFDRGLAERTARLPQVEASWTAAMVIGRLEAEQINYLAVMAGPPRPDDVLNPVLISGREPHATDPSEVVVYEQFARATGIGVGRRLPLKLLTTEEFFSFDEGFGTPDGQRLELEVVGIVRAPAPEQIGISIFGTPALFERARTGDEVAGWTVYARLKQGASQVRPFLDAVAVEARSVRRPSGSEEFTVFEPQFPTQARTEVQASANVLVTALVTLALVVMVAGAFVIFQAVARRHAASADEQFVEAALGITPWERAVARAIPSAILGVPVMFLTAMGAYLVSGWTPAGSIARYEPRPGRLLDPALMLGGALVVAGFLVLAEVLSAARAGRRRSHIASTVGSAVAERAAALGAAPSTVVGLRNAFARHGATGTVPTRTALLGATLGIAGVVAVSVFSAGLARLASSPERYGWAGDAVWVDLGPEAERMLTSDRRVGDLTVIASGRAETVNGDEMTVYALRTVRGGLAWTMLEGTMPRTRNEIALGPRAAKVLGVKVGDTVAFADERGEPATTQIVVGIGLGPTLNNEPLGGGAAVHPDAFDLISTTTPFRAGYVRAVGDVGGAQLAAALAERGEVSARETPAPIANLSDLGALPNALAGLLALVAAAAVANALIVGARRRRLDMAILKALGFTRREAARTVLISAVATIMVALAVGTPGGMAVGAALWSAIARSIFVADDPLVPSTTVAFVGVAAIVVTAVLATGPARRAARMIPAEALRTE